MSVKTFLGDFELLTDASNAVVKLQEIILQLAVRGKLVHQDSNDEPASILLERIKAERLKLASEGKIRKFEPLASVSEDETPFALPKGWSWARFPELGEFGRGKSKHRPRNDPKLYEDGKYPLVQTGDVARSNGLITTCTGLYNDIGLAQSRLWSKGTLCISIAANIADSGILNFDACIPDSVVGFIPSLQIQDARYFEFFMRTAKEHLQDYAPSTAQKNINLAILEKVLIPLPPLAEQKRIVEKCDRLLILCDEIEKRQQQRQESIVRMNEGAVAQLLSSQNPDDFRQHWQRICNNFDLLYSIPETIPKLRQAILQLAVQGKLVRQDPNDEPGSVLLEKIKTERTHLAAKGIIKKFEPLPPISDENIPFELPEGWTWARFPELGEFGRGKSKHRPRNDPKLYEDGKHPVVQTGDVARANGIITTYTGMYNDVGLAQSRLWAKGTLCITIAANIADSGILGFDACIPDSVVGFIPSKLIGDTRYFEYFMRTAKEHLQDYAPSTAQKNINLAILEKVLIPFPSLAEQKRIVAKVDRLMSLCDELEGKLKEVRSYSEKLMEVAAREVLAV